MEKTPQSHYRIRFQDCDPFRHLNNARFIDYCFNAREDHLREYYALDVQQHLRETGCSWVVVSNQIAYFKPALLSEEICITTQLIDWTDKTVAAEMIVWDKARVQIKSVLWTRFAYVSAATGKSTAHPEALVQLFRHVCLPLTETQFELRSQELLHQQRATQTT